MQNHKIHTIDKTPRHVRDDMRNSEKIFEKHEFQTRFADMLKPGIERGN